MYKHGWTVGGVFSGLGWNPRRLISDWVPRDFWLFIIIKPLRSASSKVAQIVVVLLLEALLGFISVRRPVCPA